MRDFARVALPTLAAIALTACGGTDQATTDSATIAPVGSYQDAADSALAAGNNRIDSLKAAGQTPATGLDSAAAAARTSGDTTARRP